MKRMKDLISIILCLLFVVSTVTACNKGDTDEVTNVPIATKAPEEVVVTEPTMTPSVEPLELTLGIWPDDKDNTDITIHEGYLAEFKITHPDVKIVPSHFTYSVDTFEPLAKSKNLPTIFQTYITSTQKILEEGYAADITDLLKARGWVDSINPSIKKLLSKDGRIYGIPCDSYALCLMINAELFKKAGLVDPDGLPLYPKTWAELANTGKKIKDATGTAGFCLLAKDYAAAWQYTNIAWSFGATLISQNSDGSFTCNLDSSEAIAAMEYVKSLKWNYDILTEDPLSEDYSTVFTQLGTGAAAICFGANDVVDQPTLVNGLPLEDLFLAPIPAGPNGEQYSLFDGTCYIFSKDASDAQINAALDYITIMGKGPSINNDSFEKDCKNRAEEGKPVIYPFPHWVNQDTINQETTFINKYSNVDMRQYKSYFDIIKQDGNLHMIESGTSGEMYQELTNVIQAVIKDENADVASLLKKADENYQLKLDVDFKYR